jgi:hypothetical protein
MSQIIVSACPRCQGSVYVMDDEFGKRYVCCVCARDYEIRAPRYQGWHTGDPLPSEKLSHHRQPAGVVRGKRSDTDVRWWDRNAEIVQMLDAGDRPADIALVVGKSARQIRLVNEQLGMYRALAEESQ